MSKNIRKYSIFLATVQICCLLTPSHAMFDFFGGGGGGGGGGSDVAEILAAGLITKMLMEDFFHIQGAPLLQSLRHQFIGGYSPRHPPVHHQVRHYPHMIAPRVPMAMSAQYVYPMVPRHPVHLMSQASYMQQARHPIVAAPWNGHYGDLRGSETFVNAYLPVQQERNTPPFIEALLTNEALSAATLLLNSDILEDDEEEEAEVEMKEEVNDVSEVPEKQVENRSETFEASGSENESRYILPRIVRHFVQRIMRRVEQHR
ncbi:uncharacterized protein [Parasteatoda tepidariorum]|uniref:uncharacterized protein n=1 Tax=Parasteatoda tepidariorum TaxID=114398 RepID=UPI00077FE04E|nr:uncharacterized protein LOC107438983 [Parasteatoda tepidariorum]